jgi:uncharacterized protein
LSQQKPTSSSWILSGGNPNFIARSRETAVELAASVYGSNIQLVKEFPDELARCVGFEWDTGNADKNWDLHKVTRAEAEGVFFNRPFIVAPDSGHSQREPRYAALGRTDQRRLLTVIFTVRGALLRVISPRDMSRRERRIYEQASSKE